MSKPVKPIPDGFRTVTPYLLVPDAPGVLEFIERAFDGEVLARYPAPDGRLAHADARIGDSRIMVGQTSADWPATSAMLHLYVEDVDAVYRQAVEAGGRPIREPEDMPYGDRSGGVADPYGNLWWVATHIEDVDAEEIARRETRT